MLGNKNLGPRDITRNFGAAITQDNLYTNTFNRTVLYL